MAVYRRLIGELDSTAQHLSEQISEIDLTDPEDARVLMPEQGADILAHFGDDQFLTRYQRYKAHIAEWRQQYPQAGRGRSSLRAAGGAGDGARRRRPADRRRTTASRIADRRARSPAMARRRNRRPGVKAEAVSESRCAQGSGKTEARQRQDARNKRRREDAEQPRSSTVDADRRTSQHLSLPRAGQ